MSKISQKFTFILHFINIHFLIQQIHAEHLLCCLYFSNYWGFNKDQKKGKPMNSVCCLERGSAK